MATELRPIGPRTRELVGRFRSNESRKRCWPTNRSPSHGAQLRYDRERALVCLALYDRGLSDLVDMLEAEAQLITLKAKNSDIQAARKGIREMVDRHPGPIQRVPVPKRTREMSA